MDWSGCNLVEVDAEKVGGKPLVRGTRIPAEVVLIDEEYGRSPEQTHNSFLLCRPKQSDHFSLLRIRVERNCSCEGTATSWPVIQPHVPRL